ncbi:hypothetical protein HK104_009523 [Borealophlyctis nickersoniae]|nr:hypothetical protein HK104_009523 [Borealophlyctis nickersoniae]
MLRLRTTASFKPELAPPDIIPLTETPVVIGRVRSFGISRQHATITPYPDDPSRTSFLLTDNNSTNGVLVNGKKIPSEVPVAIKPGDVVVFGGANLAKAGEEVPTPSSEFRYMVEAAPVAASIARTGAHPSVDLVAGTSNATITTLQQPHSSPTTSAVPVPDPPPSASSKAKSQPSSTSSTSPSSNATSSPPQQRRGRRVTAYGLFAKKVRPRLKKELATQSATEITKVLKQRYRDLSKNDREEFEEMARKHNAGIGDPSPTTTTASQPAQQPSTVTDPDLLPYWSDRVALWSAQLFAPTDTGYASASSSTSPRHTGSWFTQTHTPRPPQFTKSLSLTLPAPESAGDGDLRTTGSGKKRPRPLGTQFRAKRQKRGLTRALPIRLYPNARQKSLLRQWIGCARLVYNMVVADHRDGPTQTPTTKREFRITLKEKIDTSKEWSFMSDVPYCVLDEAMSRAIEARDEVITRNRERTDKGGPLHELHFASKKDARQTITIRAKHWRDPFWFYVRLLHNDTMIATSEPPNKRHHEKKRNNNKWSHEGGLIDCDSKPTYNKQLRQWTISWIYQKDAQARENQTEPTIAAIDPGVVNFLTWYSPTLGSGVIGHRDIERIVRLCLSLDSLIAKTTRVPARKRNSHRRAQARIRQRIRHLIDECHKKSVIWLTRTFDVIVIPIFGAQRMSLRKPGRRLNRKTVRNMLTWSHGRFRERLLSKAEEVGVTVITSVSEAYTSKTCSSCGFINRKLGGSRVFKCGGCGIEMDRDVNGAKGVLLRSLVKEAIVAPSTSQGVEGFV